MDYKEKLAEFGYDWPNVSPNDLPFEPLVRVGDMVYVSGQIPERGEDILFTGQVGPDVSADAARRAAGHCAANILFWLERELGDWIGSNRLRRCMSTSTQRPGFPDYSEVGNGASEVFRAVLGDRGRHARSALGMGGLPVNVPVEVDAIVHVR